MLPGERRGVGQRRVGYRFADGPKVRHGIGGVGRVPMHGRRDHEIKTGRSELLRILAAVGNATLLECANYLGQRVALLALVQPGLAPLSQYGRLGGPVATEPKVRVRRDTGAGGEVWRIASDIADLVPP